MQGTIDQGVLTREIGLGTPSSELHFGLADPADDAALRRLMRENPMPGRISLALECEPSFSDALSVEGERRQIIVAREPDSARIVAMGSRCVREVYVNGRVTRLGYLGHLRIDSRYRRRARLCAEGYSLARSLRSSDEAPFDLTCIFADNHAARRVLSAGVHGVPQYVEYERIITLGIPTAGRVRLRGVHAVEVEPGSARRLEEIADCLDRYNRRFQFARRWTVNDLLSTERSRGLRPDDFHIAVSCGRIIGTLARWDQQGFKQVVVRDYAPALRRLRPLINCFAPLIGEPRLPAIGASINSVFLAHLALDSDDPAIALHLIEAARRQARAAGHDLLLLGLAARHSLLQVIRRAVSHRACESILYLVNWDNDPNLGESLDGRPAHAEIATL